jgi:TM2 domain-containing membrane protein YozV
MEKSDKNFVATLLLCFLLGGLGVHRFYVGKIGTGILQLITFGGLGIWVLIDLIMIAVGKFSDKQGRPITADSEHAPAENKPSDVTPENSETPAAG